MYFWLTIVGSVSSYRAATQQEQESNSSCMSSCEMHDIVGIFHLLFFLFFYYYFSEFCSRKERQNVGIYSALTYEIRLYRKNPKGIDARLIPLDTPCVCVYEGVKRGERHCSAPCAMLILLDRKSIHKVKRMTRFVWCATVDTLLDCRRPRFVFRSLQRAVVSPVENRQQTILYLSNGREYTEVSSDGGALP